MTTINYFAAIAEARRCGKAAASRLPSELARNYRGDPVCGKDDWTKIETALGAPLGSLDSKYTDDLSHTWTKGYLREMSAALFPEMG